VFELTNRRWNQQGPIVSNNLNKGLSFRFEWGPIVRKRGRHSNWGLRACSSFESKFETTARRSKRLPIYLKQAPVIQNDCLLFETNAHHSKWLPVIRNNRLSFKTTASHLKRLPVIRNNRPSFKTTCVNGPLHPHGSYESKCFGSWHMSSSYRLSWSLWLAYTTSVGDLQVSIGYLRLSARNYLRIQINIFPQVLSDPGRHIKILQIPAGYLPGQINSQDMNYIQ